MTHNSRISVTHDNLRTWQLRIRQLKESDRGCYMCQINTSIMKIQNGCLDVYGKFGTDLQYNYVTNVCRFILAGSIINVTIMNIS